MRLTSFELEYGMTVDSKIRHIDQQSNLLEFGF